MRRGRRPTAGRHAPHRSRHRRCRSSCRRNRRTASRRPHAAAASSATTGLPRPDRVRRPSCGRNRRGVRRDIPPRPVAASRPCGATRGGSPANPAATANPWPWSSGPDRGASPVRCRQDRPAAANRRRLRAPGAGTLRRRSGQSRDWRESGAWRGPRPTAATRRGSCAWVISVGPSPLLSKKERSPADSRITQRRSSRPSTALLPWSPSTGTGGRHPPETVVAFNRKPRSPWPGARMQTIEICELAQGASIGNPLAQFAIVPVLDAHQNQRAQDLLRRQAATTSLGVLQAPCQIAADLFDHVLLVVKKIGNGLQQRLKAQTLTHQLPIGKTDLSLHCSRHRSALVALLRFGALSLQRFDISRCRSVQQFLQRAPVVQTALHLRNKLLRNVDRNATPFRAIVKYIALMLFARQTSRAVRANAPTAPQAQRAKKCRPQNRSFTLQPAYDIRRRFRINMPHAKHASTDTRT